MARICLKVFALVSFFAWLCVSKTWAAEEFIFRGTDDNSQESCAADGDLNAVPRQDSGSNSDAAHDAFLARLNKEPASYSFEEEDVGALPSTHSFVFDDPNEPVTASVVCAQSSGSCAYTIKNDTQDGLADSNFEDCPSLNGRYPITGEKWLDVEENEDFSISFDPPVKGFSFFASDIGDRLGSLYIIVERADGSRLSVNGSENIPLVAVASAEETLNSGARTFFGVYTTALEENRDSEFISRVFFNKTIPPNAPSNDGFGFDEFAVLTPNVDPIGVCRCLVVYNWSPQCMLPDEGSLSVSDSNGCACIRFASDDEFDECETQFEACSDDDDDGEESEGENGGNGGGGDDEEGGPQQVPSLNRDLSDNLRPSIVRTRYSKKRSPSP